jgi:adenosylcobinamide-phosphate synthase
VISSDHLWILAAALILDAIVGDPEQLWRQVPHPVVLIGRLIGGLDSRLNRDTFAPARRRQLGVLALAVVVLVCCVTGLALEMLLVATPFGWIGMIVVAAVMLAGRSLYDHVAAVATAFKTAGIDAARREIAKIVGRDPDSLDEAGLSRAAIESAAENLSDGLVAPAFWFALLGLPGLFAYKAVNTADSMLGHRSARYRDFGWASARLDDLVNWPAARLSAVVVALAAPFAGGSVGGAFRVIRADARNHRSPNAGWPEAAMAGALDVALAGPRGYGGMKVDDPFLNAAGRPAEAGDIRRALRVYVGAWALVLLVVLVVFLSVL